MIGAESTKHISWKLDFVITNKTIISEKISFTLARNRNKILLHDSFSVRNEE